MQVAVVHADESCLGNGRDGPSPGGAGALIEIRVRDQIERRDLFLCSNDSTNNQMALSGAIAVMELLATRGRRVRVVYVSDSKYLVDGMNEWVPAWRARGWRRKGGAIENLELWKTLTEAAARHQVVWKWVRGHDGHAKNEYVDHLAVRAAEEQIQSHGAVASELEDWLDRRRAAGHFTDYDPDAAFASQAAESTAPQ